MKSILRLVRCLALLLALVAVPCAALAAEADQERILDFKSMVQVHPDASITVTETIAVQALGKEIKRGIFRWLPTRYTGPLGMTSIRRYEILSVERDGKTEPHHLVQKDDRLVLYIGHKDVRLDPGTYTYTLSYRSWRQIGYFDDFDELYWNVTGNYWSFPIEKAMCTVSLPAGAPVLRTAAYVGSRGEQGQAFRVQSTSSGDTVFETTRALPPGEGFTVAVAWPKGVVYEPGPRERFWQLFDDNLPLAVALLGTLLTLGYYIAVWFKVGKDPQRWTVVPLFTPPQNLSPAAARYVMRMGFDNKAFAAALINMAVRGHLEIEEESGMLGSTSYTLLRRTEGVPQDLSKGERAVFKLLFSRGDHLELTRANRILLRKTVKKHKSTLKQEYEKTYFLTNANYLGPGLAMSLLTLLVAALSVQGEQRYIALFMTVWLSIWTLGCIMLLRQVLQAWKSGSIGRAIFMSLFSVPFVAGEVVGLGFYAMAASWPAALCLALLVVMSILFYQLLKAPTFAGRRLMDEIEGFKLYLGVAEKERLDMPQPFDRTPELFERYLPYALALDVENRWSEQFANVLAGAGREGGYSPSWYHGSSWSSLGAAGFAGGLSNSLTSAVSSASSSSGSGGGGGAGGGGGGGGGGGW